MKIGLALAGSVLALGLGGCISDAPGYKAPVIARQLDPVVQHTATFAAIAAAEARVTPDRPAPARSGGTAPGLEVTLSDSSFGFSERSYHVDVAGTVRNTGTEPRTMEALMVALVDRLDLPIMTIVADMPRTLAPGEAVSFSQRLNLNTDPMSRAPWGSSPTWQMRVGAMGRQGPPGPCPAEPDRKHFAH